MQHYTVGRREDGSAEDQVVAGVHASLSSSKAVADVVAVTAVTCAVVYLVLRSPGLASALLADLGEAVDKQGGV